MNRIVEAALDGAHYTVDACFIWCFDRRFEGLVTGVMKHYGFTKIDPVNVAGGIKDLADGSLYSRNYLLNQIDAAVRLHGAKNVVLMAHYNCGAYGKHFANDLAALEFYAEQIEIAANIVRNHLKKKNPDVKVIKVYCDFMGAIELE